MIRPMRSHSQYLEFVQTTRHGLDVKVPHDETPLWCKFRRTNLSKAYPILARLYDAEHGRPAYLPEDMLRSLLIMLECHITSIEVWVARMREQPFYAILSGFAPNQVPGVGTFYDFQDRVLQLDEPALNHVCQPRRRREQREKDPALRDKNNTAPHAHILNRLANRLTARTPTPAVYGQWQTNLIAVPTYQRAMKEVFYAVFVSTSVTRGLIYLDDLHVAGDGTKLQTWANAHGHKLCSCDNRNKSRADHCDCMPAPLPRSPGHVGLGLVSGTLRLRARPVRTHRLFTSP
jgi:hypothetical protein